MNNTLKFLTLPYLRQRLNDPDAYSLQMTRTHLFKTANVHVSAMCELLDIDLLPMANLEDDNDTVRILLRAIDILWRKLWLRQLKNKTTKTVLSAMKNILDDITPLKKKEEVRADNEGAFSNQCFKKCVTWLQMTV